MSRLLFAFLLGCGTAWAAPDPGSCDRTGDSKVTAADALVALKEAVNTCRLGYWCDSNGDGEVTAADALALLRYAVDLPVELQCGCTAIDQCFKDSDCVEGYPPNYHCAGYLCVRCESDSDCDVGEVCDLCTYDCVPGPQ